MKTKAAGKITDKLTFPESLYDLVNFEIFILILVFFITTYLFYKFFLQKVSQERHQSIQSQLKNIFYHAILFVVLFICFTISKRALPEANFILTKLTPYFASLTYIAGAIIFIKTCRLFVLQYLFLGSIRAGVPLLLVNIFSLLLTTGVAFGTLSKVFNIDLTPILATSAAFSIVLGLALQDTLGNLFAGISIQVDKTFEIGDWVEVQNGLIKIIGQVTEQSWRSTILLGLSDELITLPNKLIASCQVSNFSPDSKPIIRTHIFRIKHKDDIEKIKDLLERAASQVSDVCGIPSPTALLTEVTEHFALVKIVYFIQDYGSQHSIGDKVISTSLKLLQQNGFEIANQVVEYKESKTLPTAPNTEGANLS